MLEIMIRIKTTTATRKNTSSNEKAIRLAGKLWLKTD